VDNDRAGLLGLFPALDTIGGVQESGRIAWQRIAAYGEAIQQKAYLFCYGNGQKNYAGMVAAPDAMAASKLSAIAASFKKQWPVQQVLIWHLGLLKLLPFFRVPDARVTLFLHGIESWKRQDAINHALLQRVNLFLSNSEFTWRRFTELNPFCQSAAHKIVPLGIGYPLTEQSPVPADIPIALMLSRLDKREDYKGHREMIGAWPLVLERLPDAELWIVGDGNLRTELERLVAERKLDNRVRFFGEVSEAKKQEMLASARCLALPSRGEGFGLVYLEAMRLGRPCLVSDQDAGREVVNPPEAGLAVDLQQPQQITESVCELLTTNARWQDWSAQARRRYEAFFTAEHFQGRLLSCLM